MIAGFMFMGVIEKDTVMLCIAIILNQNQIASDNGK